jgi:two-component system phosphate regulon response regulator PhoB
VIDIFVIDDDDAVGCAMMRLIQSTGLAAQYERDPVNALSLMASDPPKLVLLDWRMPKISGGEVLRLMRRNPRLKSVKVIVFSADEVETLAIEAGASDFVNKGTVDAAALMTLIASHVDHIRPSNLPPS